MANETEKAGGCSSNENVDRLSDLPDNIIHEILYLVDLRCAVQTCVLSKRWRFLWTSLTDLNFNGTDKDFKDFLTFNRFVSRVLSARDHSNLSKVQLYCTWHPHPSLLHMVIKYAVSHHVQHLFMNYGHIVIHYSSFPPAFLTCPSLKTLQLFGFNLTTFGFALPNLISLSLSRCPLPNNLSDLIIDPFASCPNLKNLSLRYCEFTASKRVTRISGIHLVNLEIIGPRLPYRIEIFAPKLVSFIYLVSSEVDFCGLNLPSLNYAHIHVCVEKDRKSEAYLDAINLFKGLGNAQSVKLHSETIEVLGSFPGLLELEPSPFKRLKSLKVTPTINLRYLPM